MGTGTKRTEKHAVQGVVQHLADQKTLKTAQDYKEKPNNSTPPPAPILPGQTKIPEPEETHAGPSERKEPEQPTPSPTGTAPNGTLEIVPGMFHWYLWTVLQKNPVYHIEDTRAEYQTCCGKIQDPEKWFRTRHRPLGQIMCRLCRKNRGKFEDQHDNFKQTKVPGI